MPANVPKGLEVPRVILADATAAPGAGRSATVDWDIGGDGVKTPVFRPRKEELAGSLDRAVEAAKLRDRQEHWRLLYVALTRAEERLVIGGALGPRRSEEHTSELQSLMRISYAVFCLKKKNNHTRIPLIQCD